MQYELKTQIIEPLRPTFDHLVARYGNKPASRYLEGTVDIQAKENFHYRPLWDPAHELYDENYSALKLTDPYSFLDPRQYFYMPYVTNRASLHEAFGKTLEYVGDHNLFGRTPQAWKDLIAAVVIPLRHYESGCQMIYSNGARFAHGTSISQCCTYEAFDRIGNAQIISRVGLTLGEQSADVLNAGKALWMDAPAWQPLRKTLEQILCEKDWATSVIASDIIDKLLDTLIYRHLDEEAIVGGAGAYSLLAQHVAGWYAEHRKWTDAMVKAWFADANTGAANKAAYSAVIQTWMPRAVEAASALAAYADSIVDTGAAAAVAARAAEITAEFEALGLAVK